MPSRTTTQHRNNLQSTHLYIEFSPSLTKNIYRQNHLKLALQKNEHDKKDIKTINKHANKTMVSDTQLNDRTGFYPFSHVKGTTDRMVGY